MAIGFRIAIRFQLAMLTSIRLSIIKSYNIRSQKQTRMKLLSRLCFSLQQSQIDSFFIDSFFVNRFFVGRSFIDRFFINRFFVNRVFIDRLILSILAQGLSTIYSRIGMLLTRDSLAAIIRLPAIGILFGRGKLVVIVLGSRRLAAQSRLFVQLSIDQGRRSIVSIVSYYNRAISIGLLVSR